MHVILAGSLTTLASQYPPGLRAEFARAIAHGRNLAGEFPIDEELGDTRRGALESTVFNDVLTSAPWRSVMKATCSGPKGRRLHIKTSRRSGPCLGL